MTAADKYVALTTAMKWPEIRQLWGQIQSGNTPDWPPGKALEYMLVRAFQLDGAVVRWPYSVSMGEAAIEQIDGVIHINARSFLLECKDTGIPASIAPVFKLRAQLLRRPASTMGMVVSRSGFTIPALLVAQLTSPPSVLLWSGEEVDHVLKSEAPVAALEAKYRACVEFALIDYDVRVEDL